MKNKLVIILVVIFALMSLVSTGVSFYLYRQYRTRTPGADSLPQSDADKIMKKIGAVFELPSETPTVVTVVDREKLQGQAFFQKAQNGDQIIVFENARRVLLYRPSTGKIVDFAPLVVNSSTSAAERQLPSPTPSSTPLPLQPSSTATGSSNTNVQ